MPRNDSVARLTADRWRQIDAILDRALDVEPAAWPALVAEACGDDAELRREVESLLAEYGRLDAVLADDAGEVAASLVRETEDAQQADRLIGERLGAWRVVRQIGHGGMSRVFLGERADGEFAQRAAIKVLRAGLDTASDFERFRAERRILASLAHPNIARLFDGGVAPDGRPYLVLEYVEGEPLTTYCDTRGLDVPTRLRLFLEVAEATQSAHRQLVVHRDLKPSNILVGRDGRPRLLDFGIAKILETEPGGTGSTGVTGAPATTQRRWLTPHYAAPEQFNGGPVTTSTDVYQLGAVLYELLSGHRPFESSALTRDFFSTQRHRDDPAPPSVHRRTLPGDLDAVVLKALRYEPGARYASVAEFAADVQRALNGEAVAARDGDRAYRWSRRIRRHALPLTLAATALLVITGYVATLSVQNRRIARALAQATEERARATAERDRAEQATNFLSGLFRAEDVGSARSDTISARTLLERGEARANALERQPAAQAAMLDVIGLARVDLGAFDEARPSLERTLAIRRQIFGDSHPDVARSLANIAKLDERVGRFAEAEQGYRAALVRLRVRLGDTAQETQETLLDLGAALHAAGRHREASQAFAEWERGVHSRPPRRDDRGAQQLKLLGDYTGAAVDVDSAALARAERYFRDAIAIWLELHDAQHPKIASTQTALAHVHDQQRRFVEADTLYAAAQDALRSRYPDGHPDLAETLYLQGRSYTSRGRYADAEPILRESAEMVGRFFGPDHPQVSAYLSAYGDALRGAGKNTKAVQVLRDAEARLRRQVGEHNIMTIRTRVQLSDALLALGRARDAEAILRPAYERLAADRGVNDRHAQQALRTLVKLYESHGRQAEAARYRSQLDPSVRGNSPG